MKRYHPTITVPLVTPCADTRTLVQAALCGLRQIYRDRFIYKKASVMLAELGPAGAQNHADLFAAPEPLKNTRLMATMDQLNQRFGRGTLRVAAEGIQQVWKMKRERMSPCYTTNWNDILVVKAD